MNPDRILFYDGECRFCHWTVRRVALWARWDAGIHFAPLQGATAAALRRSHPALPSDLDAVAYLESGEVHSGPSALWAMARHFRWPWRFLALCAWLPRRLSSLAYGVVAANRHRFLGKAVSSCVLPTPELRARQLD